MTTGLFDNKAAWDELGQRLGKDRPSVGKVVKVSSGKYAGRSGRVTWHGVNKFKSTRYITDAQFALRELAGRIGYRVQILCDDGVKFFVDADNVEVQA